MRILIIFIFLLTNSFATEISDIKNIEEVAPQVIVETGLVEEAPIDLQPETNVEFKPISENDIDTNSSTSIDTNVAKDQEPESVQNSIKNDAVEEDTAPQNLLGDLDPNDRLSREEDQGDVLDIPAFLRRQAN